MATFYDGAEVLAAHRTGLNPDVVTDFFMPKLDGLALAARSEEHHPECRIVMVPGRAALLGERANRGTHFTVLEKPVPALLLIEAVSGKAA